jgi:hypothetical protein
LGVTLLLWGGVLMPGAASGQSFAYAEECITNVDNATVHVPAEAAPSLPDGTPVETGDTLAVYTAQGTCAGYGVWTDAGGATFAAAGSNSIDASPDGYAPDDSLQFEVFDVSAGTAVDVGADVTLSSCGNVGVPVCAEGSYADGTFHRVTDFQPDPTETVTRTIALADGWNFVSLPVVSDASFDTPLPDRSGAVTTVSAPGYTSIEGDESLAAGAGAAVQCQPDSTSVTGEVAPSFIEVEAGWNLIGSLEDTVAVDAVTASPAGMLTSDFFRLPAREGYTSATTLYPGKGYWVKTAEAGTLDVSGASGSLVAGAEASDEESAKEESAKAARLSFVDANGQEATVRLEDGLTEEQRSRTELPPVPPGEVFDVRFASGHGAAPLASGAASGTEHDVRIWGAAFPVEVRLETSGADQRFEVSAGEERLTLSKERPTAQIQQPTRRVGVTAAPSPEKFRLGKASPNPLRGRAELEYTLPETSEVSIAVYDMLGRRVARLVDAKRRTGVHQTQVDAGALPSGKYFVRMQVGTFRQTRQLTVVR